MPVPENVNPPIKKAKARRGSLFITIKFRHLQLLSAQSNLLGEEITEAHVEAYSEGGLRPGLQTQEGIMNSE